MTTSDHIHQTTCVSCGHALTADEAEDGRGECFDCYLDATAERIRRATGPSPDHQEPAHS